jgi:hypothetical protein
MKSSTAKPSKCSFIFEPVVLSKEEKLDSLAKLTNAASCELPIYVRFQFNTRHLTVPVVSLLLAQNEFIIRVEGGETITVSMDELVDVVAFRDGAGKPVFLTSHFDGKDIVEVLRAEEAEEIKDVIWRLLKHKDEYLSLEGQREDYWERRRKAIQQVAPDQLELAA